MKRLLTFLLILNCHILYSQTRFDDFQLDFEDTTFLKYIIIDTISFPDNLWQVGRPQKPLFNTAASHSNVIITDTIHSYPINNNSVFYIRDIASNGDIYGLKTIAGKFNVQTDSLHDGGRIHFSPDNGKTWIDLINDTNYKDIIWYSNHPVLTGNSHGWKNFDVILSDIGSVFNVHFGDTLLYRFTFTSDSITENLGGIMYDDIHFYNFVEGISEIRFKPIKSKIYPNPSINIFTIEFENPESELYQLSIYDIHSKLVFSKDAISGNKIIIDSKTFNPGTYIYKLTNQKAPKRCWGKFVISE